MGDRSVHAGQTIRLRARFKDDLNEVTTASGVNVHIWEPDADTDDFGAAFVVSGVPTFLGQGIYEFEFITPDCGPEGFWHDHWEGILACQGVEAEFLFFVSASGVATSLDCQLFDNNLIQITVPSGIQATDGSSLGEEFEFEFMTVTNPSYTNIRKVRLETGGFIGDLGEDTIQTAILEASLDADSITFVTGRVNERIFNHARREYTTCVAGSILLSNLGNLQLKSKTLGDLRVEYDTRGVNDMLNRLQNCMDMWTPQLMSGGGAKASSQPSMVVKGANDPDRPDIGRMWENTDHGHLSGTRIPAANTKARPHGSRRSQRTYWPRSHRHLLHHSHQSHSHLVTDPKKRW